MLVFIIIIGGMLFSFGILYPLTAAMIYPLYKKNGGKKSFKKYMKSL